MTNTRPCFICGELSVAKQMCSGHYQRWLRTGDPLPQPRAPRPMFCNLCDRPNYLTGLCLSHYQHKLKYGDPLYRPAKPPSPEERFHSLVNVDGGLPASAPELGPCSVWTGPCDSYGYGLLRIWEPQCKRVRSVRAHRFSWQLNTGEPPRHFVCHRCDNPPCVRFSHLFEGTHRENMLDMVSKGRHGLQRLTEQQVLAIRYAWAAHQSLPFAERYRTFRGPSLAAEHGVSLATLKKIVAGDSYPTIGGPIHVPARRNRREIA